MTIEVCTGDGLIDPSAFVCKSADLDTSAIEGSATSLEGMGSGLVEKVSTISSTWSGIGASYQAPEQESVYAAIAPASNAAADVETSFSSAAGYLRTYAEELQGVKATLQDLEERAATFRQEALRGYNVTIWDAHGLFSSEFWTTDVTKLGDKSEHIPWTEHGPAIEKNESLLAEYAAIIETVSAAATTCAAGLETLSTGTYVTEDEAITAEAIMASTELPWGYPADEDRNCSESVAHGAGNFWHGTWTGAASLIGRDPESGEWGWDKAGAAWGGLGNFALSTAVVLSPTTWAVKLVAPGSEADQWFDDRVNVAATGWGSLIGWDHQAALAGENGFHAWEEDAVATGTETIANIGTFFIPGANIAKGVSTAGKVGSIVTRVGGFAADFAIPGGSLAVGLATKGIKFSPDGLKITPYVGATGVVDALTPTGGVPPVSSHFGLDAPGTVPGGPKGGTPEVPTGPAGPAAGPHGSGAPGAAPDAPTGPAGSAAPDAPATSGTATPSGPQPSPAPGEPAGAANSGGGSGTGGTGGSGKPDGGSVINQKDAPRTPTPDDYSKAYENAKNDDGVAVDPRTEEPLRVDPETGKQGWHLKYDTETDTFVARNPGAGHFDPKPPAASLSFDPEVGSSYSSGDAHLPGGHPPTTPEATWDPKSGEAGFDHVTPTSPKGIDYQAQISGLEVLPDGRQPEYVVPSDNPGGSVKFDGHTMRGDPPVEVFLEAKDGYSILGEAPFHPKAQNMMDSIRAQVDRQLNALPEGAVLEWHVSDPIGAAAIQKIFDDLMLEDVQVFYTPKA